MNYKRMIQKKSYISILLLSLLLHNVGLGMSQPSADAMPKNQRDKMIQLVNLWDSINYGKNAYKDPYTIEKWDQLLLEQYNIAVQNKDEELIFKLSISLSFTYHSETKFKKGITLLEYLFKQKEKLSNTQYKDVLIKLEEEYRASNNIEQAIRIRKERISNHFINNYWEIYRDCGLYDAAKNDLIQFEAVPPLYTTKRLSYYFLLGGLYMEMKEIDSAKLIYKKALEEVKATILVNKKTHTYKDQKLKYWEACFMGLIVKYNMESGDYSNSIATLKYDIAQSFENSDNKVDMMNTLGKAYIYFNQYKEAKIYLDSATVLLSEKITKRLQLEHFLTLANYYTHINKIDSALHYYKTYNSYNEELYQNIQKNQSVLLLAQMEISNRRTELLAINQTLLDSNKKHDTQKMITLGLLFSLVLSISVGSIIYINSLAKSRSTKKIEAQSILINEHSIKMEAQLNHNELLLK
jgi:tetratricopeptide (TPR) repeat protein